MINTNSQSFAIALFSVAEDKVEQQLFYDQAKKLDDINKACSDFMKFLSSRSISKNERKDAVKDILGELKFNTTFIYWVWTIIDSNKYYAFSEIMNFIHEEYYRLFNIEHIEVNSASDLSQAQIAKIKNFFEQKLNKKVILTTDVNPTYIGGLKIKFMSKTYNNTFTNQLKLMKDSLLGKKGK